MQDQESNEHLEDDAVRNLGRLRGSLLNPHTGQPRLRGRLLEHLVEPPAADLFMPEHAATWSISFAKGSVSTYGDLERDGFQAWNSNQRSGQDSFAVSHDRTRFAVTDGMGGYVDKEGTAFFAKFLANYAVSEGVDALFEPEGIVRMYASAEHAFRDLTGRSFSAPTSRLRMTTIGMVGSTLTFVDVLGPRTVRVVAIGDSPAFVADTELAPTAQYGEDAQSGRTDQPLAFKLGIDAKGQPIIPHKGLVHSDRCRQIVDHIIDIDPGSHVVIGSDYFSETGADQDFAAVAHMNGEQFGAYASSPQRKSDDATLLIIHPASLLRFDRRDDATHA